MTGNRVLAGMGLVALAVFLFAAGDVVTKYLIERHDLLLILFLRYSVTIAILLVLFLPRQGMSMFRTVRTGAVLVRALTLVGGSVFMGLALQRMPVGETVAIIYLYPFGIVLFATLFLGERWSLPAIIACAAGFCGVMLIIRPGSGLNGWGVAFALMNVVPTIAYHLMSRTLARTETMAALLVWSAMAGLVVYGAALPWTLSGFAPTRNDVILIAAVGGLSTGGHILLTAAYRLAPAGLLAPVNYLHLFWAALMGWAVFGHMPGRLTATGMALVAMSGMALAAWTHWRGTAKQPST